MSKLKSVAAGDTGKNQESFQRGRSSKNLQRARHVYNIDGWGQNYFDISDQGNVIVKPLHDEGASIDLLDIVKEAQSRNLKFPLLVRFQDILRHRVKALNKAFQCAILDCGYPGVYQGVFPAKVNQLREVIEEILDAGEEFQYGLEVGSKPELMAALAMQDSTTRLLICNGYKDTLYIRMAILGKKLGKKVILVVEKFEELKQILAISKRLGVEPQLGIRLRLASKGTGKWSDSGGEKAKFGLNTPELMAAAELLIQNGLSHCLKLTHFHVGSQISDILPIKRAVQEGARFYCKLRQMGFQVEYFDVGGGLGVDYDGSSSSYDSSINYTMQEYANNLVFYLMEICKAEGVPCPTIVSESGRSVVAHHSLLLTDVLGSIEMARRWKEIKPDESLHRLVKELLRLYDEVGEMNPLEAYHDALRYKEDAQDLFMLGMMDLKNKAMIEQLFWQVSAQVVEIFQKQRYIPEEIQALKVSMSDQYLCNFSVFQSLPDNWALDQLFPIMPIHRLDEELTREAILSDITCDSDGQVDCFIDLKDFRHTLPLHRLIPNESGNEPYYLGIFMLGAYQDIMGDLHNLFGRVNEIHVFLDPDEPSGYYVEEVIEGSSIRESLAEVQYDERELKRRMKQQIDRAIRDDLMKPSEAMRLLDEYEKGLKEYTYLSFAP